MKRKTKNKALGDLDFNNFKNMDEVELIIIINSIRRIMRQDSVTQEDFYRMEKLIRQGQEAFERLFRLVKPCDVQQVQHEYESWKLARSTK